MQRQRGNDRTHRYYSCRHVHYGCFQHDSSTDDY